MFCRSTHHCSNPVTLGWWFVRRKKPNATCSRCLQAPLPLSCLLEEQRSLGLSQLEHFSPVGKSLLARAISRAALPTQLQIHTDAADCSGSGNLCMLTFPSSQGLVMRILFLKDLVFFSPSLEHLKNNIQTKTIL